MPLGNCVPACTVTGFTILLNVCIFFGPVLQNGTERLPELDKLDVVRSVDLTRQ
jgi:hypothetical protein